ncbi:hypothetical protein ACLBXB_28515 [Methylobacterium mesophilicum]
MLLKGLSPEIALRQRLEADPALANPAEGPPSLSLYKRTIPIVADTKEVSYPNKWIVTKNY